MGIYIPEARCPSRRCGAVVSLEQNADFQCWMCGFACQTDEYCHPIPGSDSPPVRESSGLSPWPWISMGLGVGLLFWAFLVPDGSQIQVLYCFAGMSGLVGGMFRYLVNIKAQERLANPQPHPLQEILSWSNPMDRQPEPTEPEMPQWPDLWWEILDHDPLMQQIHRAAEQAGLCRDCAKPEFHDDPEQECQCIGGGRAHARLTRRLGKLYAASPQTITHGIVSADEVRQSFDPVFLIERLERSEPDACDEGTL